MKLLSTIVGSNFFGFTSLKQFANSVILTKYKYLYMLLFSIPVWVSDFFLNWIWNDGKGTIILFVVILADWLSGMARGLWAKDKEGNVE